jgi:hypothetical protein
MIYTVASIKLGIIGDPYVPADGINVAALLSGGFIVEQSTPKPKKPAKTSTEPNEEI